MTHAFLLQRVPEVEQMLFEVERVLQRRRLARRNTEYFIKWANLENDTPTWEDFELLGMCHALVCPGALFVSRFRGFLRLFFVV